MAPKLYLNVMSPPSRAVLMVAKALDLEMDVQNVDKEFMRSSDMLKLNPQHTMPTLVDDDFVIWDSHAIAGYLVGTYASDDTLYPKDPKERALVDQRLHFENGVLFTRLLELIKPISSGEGLSDESRERILEAYGFLEAFLADRTWLAGDEVTIADLSVLSTVCSLEFVVPVEESEYPLLSEWLRRGKELPYFEETNREGLDNLEAYIKMKLR